MNKIKFLFTLAWVVPTLLFLYFNIQAFDKLSSIAREFLFVEDSAYSALAIANIYKESWIYGLSIYSTIPATHHFLWQVLLIGTRLLTENLIYAVLIWNFVFCMGSIRACYRIALLLHEKPGVVISITALASMSPLYIFASLSGTSFAMGTCLVLWAVYFHLRGILKKQEVLPFVSALMIGLACMVHIEYIVLWPLFFLHALCIVVWRRKTIPFGATLLQFLSGILVCAIFLWPLVHWNMMFIQIPWPPLLKLSSDQPFTFAKQIGEAYTALFSNALSMNFLEQVLYISGIIVFGITGIWHTRERILTPLLLIPFALPALTGLLTVFTGREALFAVTIGLIPFFILLAVLALFKGLALFHLLLEKTISSSVATWVTRVILLFTLVMLFSLSVYRLEQYQTHFYNQISVFEKQHLAFKTWLQQNTLSLTSIATDQPGWIAYQKATDVLDITGKNSPELLSCVDYYNNIDPQRFAQLIQSKKTDTMIIWDEKNYTIGDILVQSALPVREETYVHGPRILRINEVP